MRLINILSFILIFLGAVSVNGQNPLALYYLENVPQSALLNPAMTPRANVFIGIPGINTVYTGINTDMLGKDLIQKNGDKYVTLTQNGYDYSPLYKKIGDAANFGSYQTIAPLIFGFRTKKGYFTFTWTERLHEGLAIPKDIFSIMDKGIPDGSKLDFSKFAVDANYFREFSFGYAFNIAPNLRIGINAKFLQGLAAVKTDIKSFDINTSVDQWDLALDGTINMSMPVYVSYDEDGIPTLDSIPSDIGTLIDKGAFNFSNPGFAVDLGTVYELNEGWEFSAAVRDLGFISWHSDLNSFTAKGNYTFDGIYIDNSNLDSLDNAADDLLDSIKTAVDFTHAKKSFSTGIGPKLYIGAKYNFNHYFNMGFVSRSYFGKNEMQQEFNVSANLNLYHILTTSFSYTASVKGENSLGMGIALRGGPVQLYMAFDYLPYKFYKNIKIENSDDPGNPIEIPYVPRSMSNFNVMFGLNLIFGANGFKDEPMIDSYSEF